jgi:hypothetical protein
MLKRLVSARSEIPIAVLLKVPAFCDAALLKYAWSSSLKALCYTLVFMTLQLPIERPKEMVIRSDKPSLMKG